MHGGMFVEDILDIIRKDVLAAAYDHVFFAVNDIEETLFVKPAHVAVWKEIAASYACCRLRVIEIFPDQRCAADMDFPDIPRDR
jgi:hypothetical protein